MIAAKYLVLYWQTFLRHLSSWWTVSADFWANHPGGCGKILCLGQCLFIYFYIYFLFTLRESMHQFCSWVPFGESCFYKAVLYFSEIALVHFVLLWVCSSDKMIPIYFLRLCKVWSILHHGSVEHFSFLLFIIEFMFLSFSFLWFLFLMKYQFRNRILTNEEHELAVSVSGTGWMW